MSYAGVQAEIEKLARLLRVAPEELEYLEKVDPDDLRAFRDRATDRLFSSGQRYFDRLRAAARVVPSAAAASISERAFGPLLTARMAATVDPSTAIGVAKRLSPPFLADVAMEMDPRRAPEVIAGLPADLIASASRELAERGEWVTMGRFVGELDDEQLSKTLGVLDDEAVLRSAFVTEDRARVPRVLDLLETKRVEKVRRAAAGDPDLEAFVAEVFG